jgi:uncharacterized protein (TIGR02117 family)
VTAARIASLVPLIVLAASCVAPVAEIAPPPGAEPARSVWVLDHGWHTAIAVRRADVDRSLWPEVDDVPAATLIEIAWGDREFYMATPATAWLALKAAFGRGQSVLHVVGLDTPVAAHFPGSEIVELGVSPSGFEALLRFVSDEHERDAGGQAIRLQRGLYGQSWFYAARSQYSLLNTCNTWIARALQRTGLRVTPSGVITASDVMGQVRSLRVAPGVPLAAQPTPTLRSTPPGPGSRSSPTAI